MSLSQTPATAARPPMPGMAPPAINAGPPVRPSNPTLPPRRRRPLLLALAAALAVVGGIGAAVLWAVAVTRVDVIAVARPIKFGQTIQAADLTTAEIPPGGVLGNAVRVSQRSSVIGKTAKVDLVRGQILTADAYGTRVLPDKGEVILPAIIKGGGDYTRTLEAGDKVMLVPVPDQMTVPTPGTAHHSVEGFVIDVSPPDGSGNTVLRVLLRGDEALKASAFAPLAAAGKLAVVEVYRTESAAAPKSVGPSASPSKAN